MNEKSALFDIRADAIGQMVTRRTVMAGAAVLVGATTVEAVAQPAATQPFGSVLPGMTVKPDCEAMVPGGRAYVRINGDLEGPRPPLVLLHGGPGSSHWYFLNATAMAGERAIIDEGARDGATEIFSRRRPQRQRSAAAARVAARAAPAQATTF